MHGICISSKSILIIKVTENDMMSYEMYMNTYVCMIDWHCSCSLPGNEIQYYWQLLSGGQQKKASNEHRMCV